MKKIKERQPYPIRNIELMFYLMNAKGKEWLSINYFFGLLNYLYQELQRTNQLENYRICFGSNMSTITSNVHAHSNILALSLDEEAIILKKGIELKELIYKHPIPVEIEIIIKNYHERVKCQQNNAFLGIERPQACGNIFTIRQGEVFANYIDDRYHYYQLCPYCGYIANIPEEKLSEEAKEECKVVYHTNPKVLRKKILLSELEGLLVNEEN